MTTQPRLWGTADTATVQPELFADDGGHLDVAERCPECRRQLCRTVSEYVTCPMGHIRLLMDFDGPLDLPAMERERLPIDTARDHADHRAKLDGETIAGQRTAYPKL